MSDQSFWMWMCTEHAGEVIAWEGRLAEVTEEDRWSETAAFRSRFEGAFRKAAAEET